MTGTRSLAWLSGLGFVLIVTACGSDNDSTGSGASAGASVGGSGGGTGGVGPAGSGGVSPGGTGGVGPGGSGGVGPAGAGGVGPAGSGGVGPGGSGGVGPAGAGGVGPAGSGGVGPGGSGGSTGDPCVDLAAICPLCPPASAAQIACNAAVSTGQAAACEAILSDPTTMSQCTGGTGGSGGGTGGSAGATGGSGGGGSCDNVSGLWIFDSGTCGADTCTLMQTACSFTGTCGSGPTQGSVSGSSINMNFPGTNWPCTGTVSGNTVSGTCTEFGVTCTFSGHR